MPVGVTVRPDPAPVYRRHMSPMPALGDRHPGFVSESMRCWALVYDGTMQADHCSEQPNWTGRWFSPSGDRWWRVWRYPDHGRADGVEGVRPAALSRLTLRW